MTTPTAILAACLTLVCIGVHDRLAMRRIEARRRVTEAAQETAEASEAAAARAHQRAKDLAEHQARASLDVSRESARIFVEANRKAAEAWAEAYEDDEPWRGG